MKIPNKPGHELYVEGYQTALKHCLDDLAELHRVRANEEDARKVLDDVWALIKGRLNASKSKTYEFK